MRTDRVCRVEIQGLPEWLRRTPLLGPGEWLPNADRGLSAVLSRPEAADVAARLRGLGFAGTPVSVTVTPKLSRDEVREARTVDARRRRDTTPLASVRGLRLDDEGRMSWTPEALAMDLTRRFPATELLDAGCGAGSVAIAYARAGALVLAVDASESRLADARHNARLYGVERRIRFVLGDAREAIASASPRTTVFVDPPWGADWSRIRTTAAELPLLAFALERWAGGTGAALLAKVPSSFDATGLGAPEVVPFFGQATGDARRIKFLACLWSGRAQGA